MIDIIIPTWNNREYLEPCLTSLMNHRTPKTYKVIVVNNGDKRTVDWIPQDNELTVIQSEKNGGWEGGLKLGLEHSKSEYVIFMNDDTYIPLSSRLWVPTLLKEFDDLKVGAVGPSSNVVMGSQNVFLNTPSIFPVNYLIGFCMMVRREALDKVGGVDDTLPGGDDLDLSIRLRKEGYKLLANKEAFVYHHGFKSGTRLVGDHNTNGGWNSYEMLEKTNLALIKKHGLKAWYECLYESPKE